MAIMAHAERTGPDPAVAAELVHRIIRNPRPRLRYAVAAPSQRLAEFGKRLLPGRAFERTIKRAYETTD